MNKCAGFPGTIRSLREEKRISQKAAAQQLGISQALLSHYEKGIRECKLNFLVRLADYYGVTCDHLLGTDVKANGPSDDIHLPDAAGKRINIYAPSAGKAVTQAAQTLFAGCAAPENTDFAEKAARLMYLSLYYIYRSAESEGSCKAFIHDRNKGFTERYIQAILDCMVGLQNSKSGNIVPEEGTCAFDILRHICANAEKTVGASV